MEEKTIKRFQKVGVAVLVVGIIGWNVWLQKNEFVRQRAEEKIQEANAIAMNVAYNIAKTVKETGMVTFSYPTGTTTSATITLIEKPTN